MVWIEEACMRGELGRRRGRQARVVQATEVEAER